MLQRLILAAALSSMLGAGASGHGGASTFLAGVGGASPASQVVGFADGGRGTARVAAAYQIVGFADSGMSAADRARMGW